MSSYKGITFRDGYTSFAEFKSELENTHIFKAVPHKEREAELKKAYKIATAGANEKKKENDELSTSPKDSKKSDTPKDK